jgi:hypothetical protein
VAAARGRTDRGAHILIHVDMRLEARETLHPGTILNWGFDGDDIAVKPPWEFIFVYTSEPRSGSDVF